MRIREIEIKGLFGMFYHKIPLNLNSHLTIIYGENGIGKTMIFKLLDWLFNISLANLTNIQKSSFTELSIFFETNSILKIINIAGKIKIIYVNEEGKEREISIYAMSSNGNIIPIFHGISTVIKNSNLYFIQTQRLLYVTGDFEGHSFFEDTATQYAKELSKNIKEKTYQYRKLSDDLKNSLSQRILSKNVKIDYDITELQALAQEVDTKRKQLQAVGLMEKIAENFHIPNDIDELGKAILAVNIQDMQTQLKIYEEDNFYQRLKLFIEILNERRLSYKKITLSEIEGFSFTNDNNIPLKPNDLSSGEQHELVLLYQLLFKIPSNALILLDEPEISLHITWQKEFIDDMNDIIKLRNFDVLLATHSPSIINGNWDLTVSLTGRNHEEQKQPA